MFPSSKIFRACLISTALTACAGLDTRLPEIDQSDLATETEQQETKALQNFQSDAATLLNIGWPILTENAVLCPKTRPSVGVKTHVLRSYPKRLREGASRILGAEDIPRIFHIADGSPAALAGFRRGDIILNDKGAPAKLGGAFWKEALANNAVDVRRGDETLTLTVNPVLACDYNIRLAQSTAINAYADGRNITVTTGMIGFTKSDDELALIVGHELGHNTMGHIPKSIGNFILSLGGTRYTRPFESEADYVGLYYMVRAGYSPENVEAFWQRLSSVAPKSIHLAKTHPTFPERYLRIRATQDEISNKLSSGEPLLPNFKAGSASSKS